MSLPAGEANRERPAPSAGTDQLLLLALQQLNARVTLLEMWRDRHYHDRLNPPGDVTGALLDEFKQHILGRPVPADGAHRFPIASPEATKKV